MWILETKKDVTGNKIYNFPSLSFEKLIWKVILIKGYYFVISTRETIAVSKQSPSSQGEFV